MQSPRPSIPGLAGSARQTCLIARGAGPLFLRWRKALPTCCAQLLRPNPPNVNLQPPLPSRPIASILLERDEHPQKWAFPVQPRSHTMVKSGMTSGRPLAALMGKMPLAVTITVLGCLLAGAAPLPQPDAQGWNGSGWYVTSATSPAARSEEVPTFILFNGPYPLQNGCLEVYDRLYSPIGICRFLNLKPAAFSG